MRTKASFYNFLVNVISSLIIPLLGFLKVRLFVEAYGSEINGLQLVFTQIIAYLNIFELSFSLAFRQLLFTHLASKNYEKVKSIYHGARKIFKITGWCILGLSFVTSFIVPIYVDSPVNYGLTMILFLISCLPFGLSYFLMGPNFVIIADQKEYKISIWIQVVSIIRMILMITVIYLRLPFIWVFIIEGVQVFTANLIARNVALKAYPWLKEKPNVIEKKEFVQNAKYTSVFRLATIANNNTDNLVISGFLGLTQVSIYGAYSYLYETVVRIINSAITSPINSFGNLFNDKEKDAYAIFTEYFNLASYIASIIAVCVFVVMDQFVVYWIGDASYLLPPIASLLFALNIYYLTQREPIIITRDVNGLFKDAQKNAYLSVATKITLSILLIQKLGVVGVLCANLVTNWVVDFLYNPILVYKKVFNLNPLRYYKMILSRVLVAVSVGVLAYVVWQMYLPFTSSGFLEFLMGCIVLGITVLCLFTIIYYISYKSYRNLIVRIINLLKSLKKSA